MKSKLQAVTLLELLISIILLSMIVLGLSGIELFARNQMVSAERRVKIQSELVIVLEHMTKNAARTVGNERFTGVNSVVSTAAIAGDTAIRFFVDAVPAGGNGAADTWIAYRYRNNAAPPAQRNQIWYCPQFNVNTGNCNPNWGVVDNIIATGITSFVPTKPTDNGAVNPARINQLNENRVRIRLQACWNPAGACGTADNPLMNMDTDIKLPSVAIN